MKILSIYNDGVKERKKIQAMVTNSRYFKNFCSNLFFQKFYQVSLNLWVKKRKEFS